MAETINITGSVPETTTALEGSQPAAEAPKAKVELRILKTLRGFKQFAADWDYKVPALMPEGLEIRCFVTNQLLTLGTARVFNMPISGGDFEAQIMCEASATIAEAFAAKAAEKRGQDPAKAPKAQSLATALKGYLAAHKRFAEERKEHLDAIRSLPLKDINPHWRTAREIVRFGAPECVPLVMGVLNPREVADFRKVYGDFVEELDKVFAARKPRRYVDIGRMVNEFYDEWLEKGNAKPFLSAALMKREFGLKQGCRYICVASKDVDDLIEHNIRAMDREIAACDSVVLFFLVLSYAFKVEMIIEAEERARLCANAVEVGVDAVTTMAKAFEGVDVTDILGVSVEKDRGVRNGKGRKAASGGEFGGEDDAPRGRGRKPRK